VGIDHIPGSRRDCAVGGDLSFLMKRLFLFAIYCAYVLGYKRGEDATIEETMRREALRGD
jgi:hypothetical protein